MANDETRQSVVEANIADVEAKYGDENWVRIMIACLKDIDISMAMLVDNGTSSGT